LASTKDARTTNLFLFLLLQPSRALQTLQPEDVVHVEPPDLDLRLVDGVAAHPGGHVGDGGLAAPLGALQ
jgi:hypothetical protein